MVLFGGKRTIYQLYHTGWRDLLIKTSWYKFNNRTVGDLFLRTADMNPNKVNVSQELTLQIPREASNLFIELFQVIVLYVNSEYTSLKVNNAYIRTQNISDYVH